MLKARTTFTGMRYTKGFLPCNARATIVMYMVNRYLNPYLKEFFFSGFDIEVDEDASFGDLEIMRRFIAIFHLKE